jgi:hypothetical protein
MSVRRFASACELDGIPGIVEFRDRPDAMHSHQQQKNAGNEFLRCPHSALRQMPIAFSDR